MTSLRPYQTEAIEALARNLAGHRSSLLQLPTGMGKTVCFACISSRAQAKGKRTLVLAHRDELIKQAARKLADVGCLPEIEKGTKRASLDASVVVASVQSLRGARLRRFPIDHFALVIIDEAHRSAARGYRDIIDYFTKAKIIGVTATPVRADRKSLGEIYETVAFSYELRQAIREGWLAPLRAQRVVVDGLDLTRIKTRAGDLAADELGEAMTDQRALRGVVVPLLDLAADRKTIVFATDVAHAKALAETINATKPNAAIALDGSATEEQREKTLAAFAAGEFQYLINCALFVEGFDEPSISCVAMARPTKSLGFYMQCIGRGTRLYPGKADCLILDFVGNTGRHRLINPADCLAGDVLDDDVRREAERLLGDGRDLEAVLEAATEPARRDEQHRAELVRYFATEIDLFVGDDVPEIHSLANAEPVTPWLVEKLKKRGVTKVPPTMTRSEAEALLSRLARRSMNGLCTLKQARQISRAGIDTRHMSFERAKELITQMRLAGWRPSAIACEPEAIAARARGAA